MSSRWKLAAAFVVLGLASAALGVAGTEWIRSPSQRVADAGPVEPSIVTAKVTRGRLDHVIRASGTIDWSGLTELSPGALADGVEPIVTGMPLPPGAQISAGVVVLEVADRPLILLPGEIPLLKNLQPGSEGDDVERLQSALSEVGYAIYDESGVFGDSTAGALTALYEDRGYEPPTAPSASPPDEDRAPSDRGRRQDEDEEVEEEVVASRSELLFATNLPKRVVKFGGAIGGRLDDPAITLSTAGPSVEASMNPLDARLLKVGDEVRIVVADGTALSKGVVMKKGSPRSSSDGGLRVPVSVRPERSLSTKDVGKDVQIVAEIGQAQPGLIVPMSTVAADDRGSLYVTKVRGDDLEQVFVNVVDSVGGRALVRPRSRGELKREDEVVVAEALGP